MIAEPPISILLLGDLGVGKSTFLSRLTTGTTAVPSTPLPPFRSIQEPITLALQRPPIHLSLSTLSSPTISSSPSHPPSLLIICYSISCRPSLLSARTTWAHLISTDYNHDESIPVMLLGLKRDLRRDDHAQVVLPHEGLNSAQETRCDRYAECSAVTGELCREVWEDLVEMAVGMRGKGIGKKEVEYCGVM